MTDDDSLIEPGVAEVYRSAGALVQRRRADGTFVTIGRGENENIASYMAAALDHLAADGRTRARAKVASTPCWLCGADPDRGEPGATG